MARTRSPLLARLVAISVALLLGLGSGAVTAQADEPTRGASSLLRQAVTGAVTGAVTEAQLAPIEDGAVALVSSLRATLPTPTLAPLDPYAATPEVRLGWLELPSIGVSQGLFEGVTLTAINRGPSHWPGTAEPGQLGNMVVAGHRTTYSRPFYDLDLLQPGDELIVTTTGGERVVYRLDRTEVVDDEAMHIVDQHYGVTATLFACHPKGSARQRIVAHFELSSTG